jgi:hypothetical protein
MSELLKMTLEALHKRLDEENTILVQNEEGFLEKQQFIFNPPASEEEIKKLPFKIPSDYEAFLKICNGDKLFYSPEYGGGLQLFSIEEILEDYQYIDYPKGWFPIGYGYDGCRLIIAPDSQRKGYLYWLDDGGSLEDPSGFLNLTFEKWFDYFIVAQGCKFWEWTWDLNN